MSFPKWQPEYRTRRLQLIKASSRSKIGARADPAPHQGPLESQLLYGARSISLGEGCLHLHRQSKGRKQLLQKASEEGPAVSQSNPRATTRDGRRFWHFDSDDLARGVARSDSSRFGPVPASRSASTARSHGGDD